jgi:hypothetical protein
MSVGAERIGMLLHAVGDQMTIQVSRVRGGLEFVARVEPARGAHTTVGPRSHLAPLLCELEARLGKGRET